MAEALHSGAVGSEQVYPEWFKGQEVSLVVWMGILAMDYLRGESAAMVVREVEE